MRPPSMKEQFERRQKAWKPNMQIVEDDLYNVDGVLSGGYVPPNATNEHEMECFDLLAWQEIVHGNESDCSTP